MGEMRFPALAEVVPGKLAVKVYLHSQATAKGTVPCWTFVSDGLWVHRQKEILLTLAHDPGEQPGDCPTVPFQFYELVYGLAAKGQLVDVGGYSDFGEQGFLGRRAIGYVEAGEFEDFVQLAPSLAAILLTSEEYTAYEKCGLARVQALLGRSHSYFPCPHWSDRRRASVVAKEPLEKSLLARMPSVRFAGTRVTFAKGELVLRLAHSSRYKLSTELKKIAGAGTVALRADIDPAADGCLVWTPGSATPSAISMPNTKPARLAGCFIAFLVAADAQADSMRFMEDGFLVSLRPASWQALRQALDKGGPFALPIGKDSFRLEWASPPAAERRAAWVLSPQKNLKAQVGARAVADYADAVEEAVAAAIAAGGVGRTRLDLRMQLVVEPGKAKPELRAKSNPGMEKPAMDAVLGAVLALTPPKVAGEALALEFLFGANGGTGNLSIMES